MCAVSIFISTVYLLLCLHVVVVNTLQQACDDVLQPSSKWFMGETPVTGLSNQLVSVFSYIPGTFFLLLSLLDLFIFLAYPL